MASSPKRTTRFSTSSASRSRRRRRRAGRRARSGSSPASRTFSVSSSSTAARRSTARTATSSSGCMPSALIVCASWRTAAPCLRPSIIKGFWRARSLPRSAPRTNSTMTSFWRSSAWMPPRRRHHRTPARPVGRREARGRGDRQPPEMRGLRPLQAAFEQVQKELNSGLRQTRRSSASPRSRRAGSTSWAARRPTSPRWRSPSPTSMGTWTPAFG